MTPFLEFEGKNVDKAVMNACDELNILKEKLRYDVISYGSTGIFGLVGAKKARIRVTLPEPAENKKEKIEHAYQEKGETPPQEDELQPPVEAEEKSPLETSENGAAIENGKNVLEKMVGMITASCTITVDSSSEGILYNIEGGNSAMLIGKRGQTLEAMQFLIEKIVNKNSSGKLRVQIDVEGYLESKRLRLEKLAQRLSKKAKATGKPVTVGQMNSHDRRIVHLALKEENGVRTQSIGNGVYRKLIIFPGKSYQKKRKAGDKESRAK